MSHSIHSGVDPESKKAPNDNRRAWKTVGYPGFCDFISLDNDMFLLRRFDTLNARVLLDLQYQITELENELIRLDEACREDPDVDDENNRMDSIRWDHDKHNDRRRRGTIVRELQPLLQRYNAHIASFVQARGLQSASRSQIKNIKGWLEDYPNAIEDQEQEYIDKTHDLMTMSRDYKTPIQQLCESSSLLQWLFSYRGKKKRKTDDETRVGPDGLMKWFSDSIVIIIGLMMLFGPLWWLNWVNDDVKRLAIITSFVTVFALSLRIVSEGRPFEVLAATAAYAAVLMVFMQKSSVAART